jgi:hypothetical protein
MPAKCLINKDEVFSSVLLLMEGLLLPFVFEKREAIGLFEP